MKRIAALAFVTIFTLLPLASECSGNGNYDRWCYALDCEGKQKNKKNHG